MVQIRIISVLKNHPDSGDGWADCLSVKDASSVYVRRQPYVFEPEFDVSSCDNCTSNNTLLVLLHLQMHALVVRAEQHTASGLVRYQLQKLSQPLCMLQTHAWQPLVKCSNFYCTDWGCVNCSVQQELCPVCQCWQACSELADVG
jgi:hypothetical protein